MTKTKLVATVEPNGKLSNGTRYVTADHLGSPRVVTNSLASVVSRHDYKPFGEELGAGIGGRTTAMGYVVNDGVRQKFTSYERDSETGLDFAKARSYSNQQGRFTSVDPLMGSATAAEPQSFNRYTYALNSPITTTDPSGMLPVSMTSACGQFCQNSDTNGPSGIGGALSSGGFEKTQEIPEQGYTRAGNAFVTALLEAIEQHNQQQGDTRPYIGHMVTPNFGVGKMSGGSYRFSASGHDGEHVLGDRNGSTVKAIPGLTGLVTTWLAQPHAVYTVFIQLDGNSGLTMVLKDVEGLSSKVKRAPFTSPGNQRFLDKNGNPISKVQLKAGDSIGRTSRWSDPTNKGQVGLHFTFVQNKFIKQYRDDLSKGRSSPAHFFAHPCGSSSPVRC